MSGPTRPSVLDSLLRVSGGPFHDPNIAREALAALNRAGYVVVPRDTAEVAYESVTAWTSEMGEPTAEDERHIRVLVHVLGKESQRPGDPS